MIVHRTEKGWRFEREHWREFFSIRVNRELLLTKPREWPDFPPHYVVAFFDPLTASRVYVRDVFYPPFAVWRVVHWTTAGFFRGICEPLRERDLFNEGERVGFREFLSALRKFLIA